LRIRRLPYGAFATSGGVLVLISSRTDAVGGFLRDSWTSPICPAARLTAMSRGCNRDVVDAHVAAFAKMTRDEAAQKLRSQYRVRFCQRRGRAVPASRAAARARRHARRHRHIAAPPVVSDSEVALSPVPAIGEHSAAAGRSSVIVIGAK
jgi:hypothetical protein